MFLDFYERRSKRALRGATLFTTANSWCEQNRAPQNAKPAGQCATAPHRSCTARSWCEYRKFHLIHLIPCMLGGVRSSAFFSGKLFFYDIVTVFSESTTGKNHNDMSSAALARARAGRPTPATKKLANTVPFGGVQTLPRSSPLASRSMTPARLQLGSRLSTSPSPAGRVQPSQDRSNRIKTTAGPGPKRYSEASHRSKQLFQPPKQLPGAGRATVGVGGAQLKVGDPIWMREEDRGSGEARQPAHNKCVPPRLDMTVAPHPPTRLLTMA